MQILNADVNIATVVPKILETPDTFIINAHVYDKPSLKPIPLEFHNTGNITPLNYMVLNNTIWTLDNYWGNTEGHGGYNNLFLHYGNKNQKIFQDTTNSNIFYFITRNSRDGYCSVYLNKYEKNNNNITKINAIAHNNNYESYLNYQLGNDINILYQTDLYIIYAYKYCSYTGSTSGTNSNCDGGKNCVYAIRKYNKQTHAVTVIKDWGVNYFHNIQLLEYDESSDNIYLYDNIHYYWSGRKEYSSSTVNCYKIYKINLSSDILTEIASFEDNYNVYVMDNPVKINNYYYIIKDYYRETAKATGDKHIYCLHKLKLDIVNDTVEQEIINIDFNEYEWTLDGIGPVGGNSLYHELKTININNKDYIVCTLHSIANAKYYPNEHKNIIFEIVKTTEKKEIIETDEETGEEIITEEEIIVEKAVVTDVIPFKNGCKGVLEYIDTNNLVILFYDGIGFYKFNNTQGKYIECYRKSGTFNTIGFDTLNRLFIQYSNGDIEIMTSLNACTLKADFTEEYYREINADTEVHYFAKNFLDEYLSTDVVISLIGPIQFKDDGSKEKLIKTSGDGIDSLPITITGSGRIEVVISQYVQ